MAQSLALLLLWLFGKSLAGFPNQINIGESYFMALLCLSQSAFDTCVLKQMYVDVSVTSGRRRYCTPFYALFTSRMRRNTVGISDKTFVYAITFRFPLQLRKWAYNMILINSRESSNENVGTYARVCVGESEAIAFEIQLLYVRTVFMWHVCMRRCWWFLIHCCLFFMKVGSSCALLFKNTALSDSLFSSTTPTRTWLRNPSIWITM